MNESTQATTEHSNNVRSYKDKIKQWASFSEDLNKVIKGSAFYSMIFGAYYFVAYTIKLDLPFPLELSILPTTLVAIGIISLFFTVLLACYFFLSMLAHADLCGVDYAELLHTFKSGIIQPRPLFYFYNWFLIYGAPVTVWLALVFTETLPSSQSGIGLFFAAYGIWALLYGFAKQLSKRPLKDFEGKHWRYAVQIATAIWIISMIGIFSSIFFLVILEARGIVTETSHLILASAIFIAFNFTAMTSVFFHHTVLDAGDSAEFKHYKTLKKEAFKTPVYFIIPICIVITLFPNIAPIIGEVPLRLLNIGGGIERSFQGNPNIISALPPELTETCPEEKQSCSTKSLSILLDLGQSLYVRTGDGNKTYKISRAGLIDVIKAKSQTK